MTKRIIFINGPAGSGKDTLADGLVKRIPHSKNYKMAASLKAATLALYGIEPRLIEVKMQECEHRDIKETPTQYLMGMTPREAFIKVSEEMVKPAAGKRFFGQVLANRLKHDKHIETAFISDSGFTHEAEPIIAAFGTRNCLLFRIHREGYGFKGDSRSYIDLPIRTIDLENNGTLDDLYDRAGRHLERMGC